MKLRLPTFPAYATPLDKLGWWSLRLGCVAVLVFLLLPILVIMPLSFSSSSFLVYPIPGWSLRWYENLFTSPEWGPLKTTRISISKSPSSFRSFSSITSKASSTFGPSASESASTII